MPDYLFLMHDDAVEPVDQSFWGAYLERLREGGILQGGSAIGAGICARKAAPEPDITTHITGFIRVVAANLDDARSLVLGNPVFEAGGTVEIRVLPQS